MTAATASGGLLLELLAQDLELWVEDGRLRYRGPRGALGPELRRRLEEHKPRVVALLGERRKHSLPAFAQRRLWFLEQLEPGTAAYNVAAGYRLAGVLDGAALAGALGEIVRRHDSLRSTFPSLEGQPLQVVAAPRGLPGGGAEAASAPAVVDLSRLRSSDRQAEAGRQAAAAACRPFDLSRGPLFRSLLLRLGARRHDLIVCLHHIVTDGWSMTLLERELSLLYRAFADRRRSPLPELELQYPDFARWQRRRLRGARYAAQLDYWRGRLDGAPPVLELPADRPRPIRRSTRGAAREIALPGALADALRGLGARRGATLFMTLAAAFLALLHRYTGQRDLPVGTPVAGRGLAETEEAIGFFVNTLVLRGDLSGDPDFAELLDRVRATVLGAFQNQDLPFEKLVEELAPERDLSRHPIFQVVLALHRAPAAERRGTLEIRPLEPALHDVRFDLAVHLWEGELGGTGRDPGRAGRKTGVTGRVIYRSDLFDATTIERFARHFVQLLAAAAADPHRPVAELPLLRRGERQQLLREWNDRRQVRSGPRCLHQLVEARAARVPERIAVSLGSRQLTYGELERRAGALAGRLRRAGAGPEARVAVLLERSFEQVIATLAVLQAGAAFLPLDPGLPDARLRALLDDARAVALLTHSHFLERLPERRRQAVLVDRRIERGAGPLPPAVRRDAAAYVIYTSGSTGRPKGVTVPHRGVVNRVAWGQTAYPLVAGDAVLQQASAGFDFSVWEIFAPLATGARLVLPPEEASEDLGALLELIARQRVSVAHFVPSLLAALLDLPGLEIAGSGTLERVFCGGEELPSALIERFRGRCRARLDNQYGPTEAAIDVTYQGDVAAGAEGRGVSIGRPIANLEVLILDRRRRPVPPGVTGEIAIGGAGLARGYLGRPARTAAAFVPHADAADPGARLYLTGDRARQLPDGRIVFRGRLDQQVQVRGVRIELEEVERVLAAHPAVERAAVVAAGDTPLARRLVAFVVPRGGEGANLDVLRRFLEHRLPSSMVPPAFVSLPALPVGRQDKVDRRALARMAALPPSADVSAAGVPVAPRGPIEELLAEIWRRVLGVDDVGAHDDFFRLGGHSLLATRVISRVRRALGREVPVRALFERRTVAALATWLAGGGAEGTSPIPAPADRAGELPLSFAQERLWFLDRLEGAGAAYNVAAAWELEGDLDLAALARSCDELVRRHESLRTIFPAALGRPRQVIAAPPAAVLGVVDLRAMDAGNASEATRIAAAEAVRTFDLDQGPPARLLLLRLGKRRHVLLTTVHHIVSDAWSTAVLRLELGALYRAFSRGAPSPLPELPVQYADFAVWQRRWLDGAPMARQLAYWRRRLDGLPELRLPLDRPRPPAQSFRGGVRTQALPAAAVDSLRELGARSGATLFMTFLAAFVVLLGRLGGQRDFAVGSPIANRGRRSIEGLIGFFVNTQVLRADLSAHASGREPTFAQLLERVRETALDAYAHQDLPFEKLVAELAPERDLSRHPLFQVLFTLHNAPRPALELEGLAVRELETGSRRVRFDLEWHLRETGSGAGVAAVFNRDLFDATTIERWLRQYDHLLRAIAEDPERRLDEVPLLAAAERHQLLLEWNAGGAPPASTPAAPPDEDFLELFAARARRAPDAVALCSAEEALSFRRLEGRALALARRLRRLGVGPEVAVALQIERSPALVIAMLAVLLAGGAYVPVDPSWPRRRRRWILEDSGARFLLAGPGADPAPAPERTIVLDRSGQPVGPPPAAAPPAPGRATPENPAYLIYTSGSTGKPKGVIMRRGALDQLIRWQVGGPARVRGPRTLQFASASFDVSFQEIFTTLGAGGTLVLIPEGVRRDAEAWSALTAEARVERLFLPVVALDQLAEVAARRPRPALEQVITAGEQLHVTAAVRDLFGRLGGVTLHNHYGPSETHVVTSLSLQGPPGRWPARPAIGLPIAGTRVHLLDRGRQPVPIGAAAEIAVGGAALARGYWRRPARTAERFVPDRLAAAPGSRLYLTGDLGRRLPNGAIEFLGRADQQLKIRGFRVEPGEIEAALERHPEIRRAVVSAVGSRPADRRLAAYLIPRRSGGAAPRLEAGVLRAWLREWLPEPSIPATFAILERLPLTPSGKVDRSALPEPGGRGGSAASFVAPRAGRERVLAEIFAELLGPGPIGAGDDFFRLGGHSLMAVRLMARIEQRLGVRLPLATLFRAPTVESLARRLGPAGHLQSASRGTAAPAPAASLVPLRERGDPPPIFLVHAAGGGVLCYRDLCSRLEDRPIFGIEAGLEPPPGDLESLAGLYLEAVLALPPAGPLLFAGWSMGGLLAFEMARQAAARGLEVSLLALFDTTPPGAYAAGEADLLAWFARDLGLPPDSGALDLEGILERARRRDLLDAGTDVARLRRLWRRFRHHVRLARAYSPGAYGGDLIHFAAAASPPGHQLETARAWRRLAAGVELVSVPGDHFTMLREPHVRALARELASRLP